MIRKSLFALFAAILPLLSCVKEEQKTEILLNLSQVSLTEGETVKLTAAVSASSATSSLEWSSLNEKVAVVADGLVTAVNPGETWIYASLGEVKEGCLVKVAEQKILSLDRKVLYMIPGQGQMLTAVCDMTLTSEVVWTTSDESIVTVEEGIVTAVADGDAYVTASIEDGKYDVQCAVHVMSEMPFDDIYIMSGASGKGDSWDNAGGEDLLCSLLNTTGDASDMLVKRIYGKTIHIAGGSYNLNKSGKSPVSLSSSSSEVFDLKVLGGYSASGSGSRNPSANKTVFTVSAGRVISVSGKSGSITFDGISFEKGNAGEERFGGAVDCSLTGTLTFNDCSFRQCLSGFGGGAVNIASGTVNFNGCEFMSNAVDAQEGAEYDVKCAGGAIRVVGLSSKLYVNNSIFSDNSALASGDIHVEGGASAYLNRCSLYGAEAVAKSLGSTFKYPACSITADEGSEITTDKTTLCIYNSTIYDAKSTAYTTGSPQVSVVSANALIANTTIYGFSMGNIRADKRTSAVDNIHIYNSLLFQTKNDGTGVNLSKQCSQKDYCSVMSSAKNGWTINDNNQLTVDDVDLLWKSDAGCLEWTLKSGKTIGDYAQKAVLESKVEAAFPEFNAWLKEMDEDPYGTDQSGNQRNPEKMNPGSWDPKLQ